MKIKQKCLSLLLALTMVLGTAFSTTAFAETDEVAPTVEPSVTPAEEDWAGPAEEAPDGELSGEEEFIFPFTTTGAELSTLELDIYLGKDGENTGENRVYKNTTQFKLRAADPVIDSEDVDVAKINAALAAGALPKESISFYEAAGAVFTEKDGETSIEEDSIKTVENNVSYNYDEETKTGAWKFKLDTEKLLDAGFSDLEFLVEAHAKDNKASWGNNNYESYGKDTKAYLYTITEPGDDGEITDETALKKAIEKASNGDTIMLGGDVDVSESIVIDKPLTLDGDGYTIKAADGSTFTANLGDDPACVLSVTADDVAIQDVTIDCNVDNVTIAPNETTGGGKADNTTYAGIYIQQKTGVELSDVTVKNLKKDGYSWNEGNAFYGIYINEEDHKKQGTNGSFSYTKAQTSVTVDNLTFDSTLAGVYVRPARATATATGEVDENTPLLEVGSEGVTLKNSVLPSSPILVQLRTTQTDSKSAIDAAKKYVQFSDGDSDNWVAAWLGNLGINQRVAFAPDSVFYSADLELEEDEQLPLMPQSTPEEIQKAITWSSDAGNIAKVQDGVVTPLSKGKANITATIGTGDQAITAIVMINVLDNGETPALYSIGGKVDAGETGASVSGITVDLYAADDTEHEAPLASATTDENGKYSFTDKVAAGEYVVVVAASEGKYAESTASVTVNDADVTNADITLVKETSTDDHDNDHHKNSGGSGSGSGSSGRGGRTVIVSGTAPDNKPVVTVENDPQGKPVVTVGARPLPNAKPLTAAEIAIKAAAGTLNATVNPNGVWDGRTVGAKNIALVIDTKEATLAPGGSYQLGVSAFAGPAGSTLRVRASRDGFVTITTNPDGTYTITSNKPVSGLYILVEILDANGNVVGHSSMKLDAATGLGVKHVENKAATIV